MKHLLTIILIGCTLLVHSQPTLTSVIEPVAGNSFSFHFADSTGITPGNSGANQIWDFSNVVYSGNTHIENWVAVPTTPYAVSFPGANIVQQVVDTNGFSVYLYHNNSSSASELMGIAFDAGGTPSIMNYNDTETIRIYPSTYNTTNNDTYAGVHVLSFGPLVATTYRTGTYSYLVDGYGTLITPVATFANTLRMKVLQHSTDSTVYTGSPIPPAVQYYLSTTYFWSTTTPGNKLYQFYIGYDTSIVTTATTYDKFVSYQGSFTAIDEIPPYEENSVVVYPNPSNSTAGFQIKNSVTGKADFILYDASGRIIESHTFKMTAANKFEYTFPVNELSSGIYQARIICGEKQWLTKIVKQ